MNDNPETTLTAERIAELRAILSRATPGEWMVSSRFLAEIHALLAAAERVAKIDDAKNSTTYDGLINRVEVLETETAKLRAEVERLTNLLTTWRPMEPDRNPSVAESKALIAAVEAARVEEREALIAMLPCLSVTAAMFSANPKTCEQWNATYKISGGLCTHCGVVALIRNRSTPPATKGEQQP